jgi:hypothetical protein
MALWLAASVSSGGGGGGEDLDSGSDGGVCYDDRLSPPPDEKMGCAPTAPLSALPVAR